MVSFSFRGILHKLSRTLLQRKIFLFKYFGPKITKRPVIFSSKNSRTHSRIIPIFAKLAAIFLLKKIELIVRRCYKKNLLGNLFLSRYINCQFSSSISQQSVDTSKEEEEKLSKVKS
jgi:hypothetical protein